MPGLSSLAYKRLMQMYGGLSPSNAGFVQRQQPYGYYDTYGSGILPGGNLQVSPSQTGQPRSMPGIDVPVPGQDVPNLTGLDYSDTLGLSGNTPMGNFRPTKWTGDPGAVINDDPTHGMGVIPGGVDIMGNYPNQGLGEPEVRRALPIDNWLDVATNTGPPNLSNSDPVIAAEQGYPIPGGGPGGPRSGNWAINARRPTPPWGMHPAGRGVDPGYIDPRGANFSAFGLHDWNTGAWATNPRSGEMFEGLGRQRGRHDNIGALAARFGMAGRSGPLVMPGKHQ